jgi:hypothetical protein
MGIFSEIKDTYRYAKKEIIGDIEKVPGGKETRCKYNSIKKKGFKGNVKSARKTFQKSIKVKQGKRVSNAKAFKSIKKDTPKFKKFKKATYKKKKMSKIKSEVFNTRLNIKY